MGSVTSRRERLEKEFFSMAKAHMAVVCRTKYQEVGLRKFLKANSVLYALPYNTEGESSYPVYYAMIPVLSTKEVVFSPTKRSVDLKAYDWKVMEQALFMKKVRGVLEECDA